MRVNTITNTENTPPNRVALLREFLRSNGLGILGATGAATFYVAISHDQPLFKMMSAVLANWLLDNLTITSTSRNLMKLAKDKKMYLFFGNIALGLACSVPYALITYSRVSSENKSIKISAASIAFLSAFGLNCFSLSKLQTLIKKFFHAANNAEKNLALLLDAIQRMRSTQSIRNTAEENGELQFETALALAYEFAALTPKPSESGILSLMSRIVVNTVFITSVMLAASAYLCASSAAFLKITKFPDPLAVTFGCLLNLPMMVFCLNAAMSLASQLRTVATYLWFCQLPTEWKLHRAGMITTLGAIPIAALIASYSGVPTSLLMRTAEETSLSFLGEIPNIDSFVGVVAAIVNGVYDLEVIQKILGWALKRCASNPSEQYIIFMKMKEILSENLEQLSKRDSTRADSVGTDNLAIAINNPAAATATTTLNLSVSEFKNTIWSSPPRATDSGYGAMASAGITRGCSSATM